MGSELYLEEDYIHMEVSSYSNLFPHNNSNPREFEFQSMSSTTLRGERDTSASPADELFYRGKLLPLHLPPRLQMVEKILETSKTFDPCFSSSRSFDQNSNFDLFSTPLMTAAPTPTATSTPFESCPVSPSDSFRIGREIITRPEEFYAREEGLWRDNNGEDMMVSGKKLKNNKVRHSSSLGSRLKASRAYLKSLFGISGCSDESSTAARKVADEGSAMKYVKVNNNKNSSSGGQIPRNTTSHHKFQNPTSERNNCHRRSFSLVLRRHSTIAKRIVESKCVSTSSSSSSSSSSESNSSLSQSKYLKRCGSTNKCLESENSIQGAIAHCKKSQLVFSSRSSVNASRIGICEEQETQQLCRG